MPCKRNTTSWWSGRFLWTTILTIWATSAGKWAALWWPPALPLPEAAQKTAIFCKSNAADADVKERFAGVHADLYWAASKATCSIRNQYFTADKEKRACTSMGVCDPFRFDELPQVKTRVYHFAGLVYGDFDGALLAEAAKHGKVGAGRAVYAAARGAG